MAQWEYLTTFIEANARSKERMDFLRRRFPGRKRFAPYAAESLMPELDKLGEEGWELVHMEPVAQVGGKGDVLFAAGTKWGRSYFCVFKRAKGGSVQATLPAPTQAQPAPLEPQPRTRPAPPTPVPPPVARPTAEAGTDGETEPVKTS